MLCQEKSDGSSPGPAEEDDGAARQGRAATDDPVILGTPHIPFFKANGY